MKIYVDSSVIVRALVSNGSNVLNGYKGEVLLTSRLTQVEVLRAITRINPDLLKRAALYLQDFSIIELTREIADKASLFASEITLKSSDAIHVASALTLLEEEDVLITHDKQMAKNAEKLNLNVVTL